MANLNQIVKISKANYDKLVAGTLAGYTYDDNSIYLVEDAKYNYLPFNLSYTGTGDAYSSITVENGTLTFHKGYEQPKGIVKYGSAIGVSADENLINGSSTVMTGLSINNDGSLTLQKGTLPNSLLKSGGTMTDTLVLGSGSESNPSDETYKPANLKIGCKDDAYGIMPSSNNWNSIGSSSLYWYRCYISNYYGTSSYITNWSSGNNIGKANTASASSTLGTVNFYNNAAANTTQTKTLLSANSSANSNITITLPSSTGTLATTADVSSAISTAITTVLNTAV